MSSTQTVAIVVTCERRYGSRLYMGYAIWLAIIQFTRATLRPIDDDCFLHGREDS